jgi:hypothetical protein
MSAPSYYWAVSKGTNLAGDPVTGLTASQIVKYLRAGLIFSTSGPQGSEVAAMAYSTSFGFTSTTSTAITGWQIVVPANSGPLTIKIPNILLALVTGTLAANAVLAGEVRLQDEAAALVGFVKNQETSINTTSQTYVRTLGLEADVANNASAKTYSVYCRISTTAGGATCTMHTSQTGFVDPVLRAVRR